MSDSVAESGSRAARLKGASSRMLDPELPENAQNGADISLSPDLLGAIDAIVPPERKTATRIQR